MSGSHDGKMRFFGCNSRNRAPHPKVFCVSPLKQDGAARAAFVDTSRAFVFEPTAAAGEVSISSDSIVFVDRDLGEREAELDPPKLRGDCALAKNPCVSG